MTDYSKLSDFEIDKAVADKLGFDYEISVMFVNPVDKVNGTHVEQYIRKKITGNEKYWKRFSPTRIPNDAWSIIVENGISLECVVVNKHQKTWRALFKPSYVKHKVNDKNPLRAAMIVFLQMQENK